MAPTATTADDDGVTFVLADPHRRLHSVRLVQDLGAAELAFSRDRTTWWFRLPRPPVDRLEYLFEVEDANGHRHTLLDPANGSSAPGAFGAKSVVTFPGYAQPWWLEADVVDGTEQPFEFDAPLLDSTVTGRVWAPDGLAGPAPLVLVHDGPEFADLGRFTRYVSAQIKAGALPPLRVALLGPGERNTWYAANADYSRTLAEVVVPRLPDSTLRIGVGVSLGALAMLHAHRRHESLFDGLLLQSGSFFCPDLDGQESEFSGWEPVTEFVASVHCAAADGDPAPIALTCGMPEENLANNQRMTATLQRLGHHAELTAVRDTHNYTAWRDALHPHLTDLVTAVTDAA